MMIVALVARSGSKPSETRNTTNTTALRLLLPKRLPLPRVLLLSCSSPKRLPLLMPRLASVNIVVPVLMIKLKQGYQSPSPQPLPYPPQPWRPAYHKGIQIRPFPCGVCARSAPHINRLIWRLSLNHTHSLNRSQTKFPVALEQNIASLLHGQN